MSWYVIGRDAAPKHLLVLATLYIGFGALFVLIALLVVAVLPTIAVLAEDPAALPILTTVAVGVGVLFLLFAIPGIVGGVGLLRRRPWARIVVLVLGAIHLLNVPIGTALGIYTFWVLIQDEVEALFRGRSPSAPPGGGTDVAP